MGTAEAIDKLLSGEQGVWLDVLLLQLDGLFFFFSARSCDHLFSPLLFFAAPQAGCFSVVCTHTCTAATAKPFPPSAEGGNI